MLFEILSVILFIGSSGLFFHERFRENRALVVFAGLIAFVSTYIIIITLVSTYPAHGPIATPPNQEITTTNRNQGTDIGSWTMSLMKGTVHSVFTGIRDVSNWVIKVGTGNENRTVSDETVYTILASIFLTILFPIIGLTLRWIWRVMVPKSPRA